MLKRIMAVLCMMLLLASTAFAQIRTSAEQARMAYICALADMAVYSTDMNEAVRSQMDRFGWHFENYKNTDKRADTTFYTLVNQNVEPGERETLVVIPGTEKLKDVEVDLRFSKVLFGGNTPEEFRQYADTEKVPSESPMVHRGFNDYTMTAFFTPGQDGKLGADALKALAEGSNEHLYITGHSLGGAVATLLAARLVSLGVNPDHISVITFGAPSVGNTAFAEEYGYRLDLSRYTMSGDMVKNALQALKSGYVHFGTEYKWQKNENSHKHNHAMAGYLDAAIRGYYDEALGGNLTLQQLAANKPELIDDMAPTSLWNQQYDKGRVYIAPIQIDMPEDIANDMAYMQVVAGDMLMNNFQRIHVDENAVAAKNDIDTLFTACQEAEEYGCEYIAQVNIKGAVDKNNPNLFRIATETKFYTTSGEPVASSVNTTTSKEITPIEATMYNMARAVDDIRENQQQGNLPK